MHKVALRYTCIDPHDEATNTDFIDQGLPDHKSYVVIVQRRATNDELLVTALAKFHETQTLA